MALFKAVLRGFDFEIENLQRQGTGDKGLAENYNAMAFVGQCAKSEHLNDSARIADGDLPVGEKWKTPTWERKIDNYFRKFTEA